MTTESTISETDLWTAIDAALEDPDVLPQKPPGWFTTEEFAAHAGMTREGARTRLNAGVRAGKLSTARARCRLADRMQVCRIYGVAHDNP